MNRTDAQLSNSTVHEPERRKHERYTVQVQIEIHAEGSATPVRLTTIDLSRGGCYVQVADQFALGVRVLATLWLDGHSIQIHGVVVTRHPQFGNGIMFIEFEGEGERLLGRYLEAVTTGS
jgi:hypothetical protein